MQVNLEYLLAFHGNSDGLFRLLQDHRFKINIEQFWILYMSSTDNSRALKYILNNQDYHDLKSQMVSELRRGLKHKPLSITNYLTTISHIPISDKNASENIDSALRIMSRDCTVVVFDFITQFNHVLDSNHFITMVQNRQNVEVLRLLLKDPKIHRIISGDLTNIMCRSMPNSSIFRLLLHNIDLKYETLIAIVHNAPYLTTNYPAIIYDKQRVLVKLLKKIEQKTMVTKEIFIQDFILPLTWADSRKLKCFNWHYNYLSDEDYWLLSHFAGSRSIVSVNSFLT